MKSKKITNIDTLSTLLDRLISEKIKAYFFEKDGKLEQYTHQLEVISEINARIIETFEQCFEERGYNYLSEKRTFSANDIMIELQDLIVNDVHIGESDRRRLQETKSENPDVNVFVTQEQRLRKANEGRSANKNRIDSLFQGIFEGLKWKKEQV